MSIYKTDIPKSWIIAAYNQVNNYLVACNKFPDLEDLDVHECGSLALFGGSGPFTEEDAASVRSVLTSLADRVSVEIFLVNKGTKAVNTGPLKIENPSEKTGDDFGFFDLFEDRAPELL